MLNLMCLRTHYDDVGFYFILYIIKMMCGLVTENYDLFGLDVRLPT